MKKVLIIIMCLVSLKVLADVDRFIGSLHERTLNVVDATTTLTTFGGAGGFTPGFGWYTTPYRLDCVINIAFKSDTYGLDESAYAFTSSPGNTNFITAGTWTSETGGMSASIDFNGSSTVLTIPDDSTMYMNNGSTDRAFTFIWCYKPDTFPSYCALWERYASGDREYMIYMNSDGTITVVLTDEAVNKHLTMNSTAITAGILYHIAVTYGGTTLNTNITIFVNGKDISTSGVQEGGYDHMRNYSHPATIGFYPGQSYLDGTMYYTGLFTNYYTQAQLKTHRFEVGAAGNTNNVYTNGAVARVGGALGMIKYEADNREGVYSNMCLVVNNNVDISSGSKIQDTGPYENSGLNGSGGAAGVQERNKTNSWMHYSSSASSTYTVSESKNTINFWGTTDLSKGWTNYMSAYGTNFVNGVPAEWSNIYYSISGSTVTHGIGTDVYIDTFKIYIDYQDVYTNNYAYGVGGNQ